MGAHHHHHHGHSHGTGHGSTVQRMRFAFWLNFIFSIIEFAGGIWTGSVAILADALHDFGDSLTLALGSRLEAQSHSGPSSTFSYGYRRLSLLSAWLTGAVLVFGSLAVAFESSRRLIQGEYQPHPEGMILLAVLGVSVNGVAAWRLSRGGSHNEKMMTWHMLEDLLGWVVVLVGAICIRLWNWTWLDPILALAISGFVGWNALKNLIPVALVFLQRLPNGFDAPKFRKDVLAVEGVFGLHDLHVWSLDGERHVMSLHLVTKKSASMAAIKEEVRHLALHAGSVHTTIETEFEGDECVENCDVVGEDSNGH